MDPLPSPPPQAERSSPPSSGHRGNDRSASRESPLLGSSRAYLPDCDDLSNAIHFLDLATPVNAERLPAILGCALVNLEKARLTVAEEARVRLGAILDVATRGNLHVHEIYAILNGIEVIRDELKIYKSN